LKKKLVIYLGVMIMSCAALSACGNANNADVSEKQEEELEETEVDEEEAEESDETEQVEETEELEETEEAEADEEEESSDDIEYYNTDEGWLAVYDPDGNILGKYNIPEGYSLSVSGGVDGTSYYMDNSEGDRIYIENVTSETVLNYVTEGIIPEDEEDVTYTFNLETNEEYNVILCCYTLVFNNVDFYNIRILSNEYERDGKTEYVEIQFLPVDYDKWDNDNINKLIAEIF